MRDFLPRPAIAPATVWTFPVPRRAQLSNGVELMIFDLPGQHVVSACLVLDVPLNAEGRDIEGVATICARTLDEGTLRHDGDEFAELLETEGAGFGVDLSLSGLQAVLDVPASHLDRALELFAEAVTEPSLADRDVNRHVQLRLAEIEQAQANSAQIASIAFRAAVFEESRRAARMNGGEPETVRQVTPEAVGAFHHDHFGPAGATLIMAGDFIDDPIAAAERCLGSWGNDDQRRVVAEEPVPAPQRTLLIDRPGAVQADVRLGGFGIDRLDPRWSAISVASYAMGGAFLSRLNAVLREEKGYTYGVRMNFGPLRTGGSFAVQGSFRTEVVVDALAITNELIKVEGAPFTSQEVDDAVAFFTGVSPLRYATADGVADQAATQVLAGLPDDYVDRSLALLRSVTPEAATEAYRSVVHPDELTLVVVGDAERLAEPLRATGFPDLEIRTPASIGTASVGNRAAAVTEPRRSDRHASSSASDDEVGGFRATMRRAHQSRAQPPSARSARFTAALASCIFFWYVPRSPAVSALSAASKAADASLSALVAAGLSASPVGVFPSALPPSSVVPPELPWNTWSSACCKVSPMPTDWPKRTTTKRSAG